MKQWLLAAFLALVPLTAHADQVCADPHDPRQVARDQVFARAQALQQARERCLADPKCREPLMHRELCAFVIDHEAHIKELLAAIAAENANPAGVVDLRELNELGRDVQATRNQELLAIDQYQKLNKRAFTLAQCK